VSNHSRSSALCRILAADHSDTEHSAIYGKSAASFAPAPDLPDLASTLIGLMLTLSAVGYTLLLSWQLEGGAAAINEAGTMRMRSYKLLSQISLNAAPQALQDELNEFARPLCCCIKVIRSARCFYRPLRQFNNS
jgi:hypothetical protein